jgi:hypothetical protein
MSGTRKMEKFELDALTDARAGEPRGEGAEKGSAADALPVAELPAPAIEVPAPRAASFDAGDTAPATAVGAAAAEALVADAPPPPPGPGPATPPDVEALRTRLTRKFTSLAESVTESFRDYAIGGGAWAVELTAPQGMSTGGGKQALQHLRLRPRKPGYSVLVAGTVNQMERRAELRDFDHLAIMHEVRFRHALAITNQEWEQFLRKAEVVLNAAGIQSMRTPPPRDLLEQRRSLQRVSRGAIVALVVVLLLASVVVWRVVATLMAG